MGQIAAKSWDNREKSYNFEKIEQIGTSKDFHIGLDGSNMIVTKHIDCYQSNIMVFVEKKGPNTMCFLEKHLIFAAKNIKLVVKEEHWLQFIPKKGLWDTQTINWNTVELKKSEYLVSNKL